MKKISEKTALEIERDIRLVWKFFADNCGNPLTKKGFHTGFVAYCIFELCGFALHEMGKLEESYETLKKRLEVREKQ